MNENNIVDQLVKDSILKYFSIFPTRMHVLTHCILGNGTGYEWIEKDDGLLYLDNVLSSNDDKDYKIKMVDSKKYGISNSLKDKGAELSNLIRHWIEDNINDYSKKGFKASGFDYSPDVKDEFFSRGYNRICDIQDMSNIAPVWIDALLEVCEYFMKKMSVSGIPHFSIKNRDYMKDNKDQFLILFNARAKINSLNNDQEHGIRLTNKLLEKINGGKSLNELLKDDWSVNFRDQITFDDFLKIKDWFVDNKGAVGRGEIISLTKRFLKSSKMYFNESGDFTDYFHSEMKVFFNKVAGWNYFDERSVSNQAMRFLKMSDYYKVRVSKIVESEMSTCYGS
jgi:hypothetical protein